MPKSTELKSVGAKTGLVDAGVPVRESASEKDSALFEGVSPFEHPFSVGERLVKHGETEWASSPALGHGVKLICSSSKPIWALLGVKCCAGRGR